MRTPTDTVETEAARSNREDLRTLFPPEQGVYQLSIGAPDALSLRDAKTLIERASADRLAENDAFLLMQYGPSAGDGRFLRALSAFIHRQDQRNHYAKPSQNLMLTTGVTGGIGLLLSTFMSPGDIVYTEELTFFLQLTAMQEDLRLSPRGVALDSHGLDTDVLERELRSNAPSGNKHSAFNAAVYVIPDHHNPSGSTLSDERREHLAALAAEFNLLVLSDDVYRFIKYDDQSSNRPVPLVEWNERAGNRIASVSSFTKLLCPGMRVGWIESSADMIKRLSSAGLVMSGGSPNHFGSGILTRLLETRDLDRYLTGLLKRYKRRKEVLARELERSLPAHSEVDEPGGGFFILICLPCSCAEVDGALVEEAKRKAGVNFAPAIAFVPVQRAEGTRMANRMQRMLRVSFCFLEEDELVEAARQLGSFLRSKCECM